MSTLAARGTAAPRCGMYTHAYDSVCAQICGSASCWCLDTPPYPSIRILRNRVAERRSPKLKISSLFSFHFLSFYFCLSAQAFPWKCLMPAIASTMRESVSQGKKIQVSVSVVLQQKEARACNGSGNRSGRAAAPPVSTHGLLTHSSMKPKRSNFNSSYLRAVLSWNTILYEWIAWHFAPKYPSSRKTAGRVDR